MTGEAEPGIPVIDRRRWAHGESDGAAAPQELLEKPSYVQELEARAAAAEAELRSTLARYREASAEFEQAKVRIRREVAKDVERGSRDLLAGLLDVVDNLDRAIEAGRSSEPGSPLLHGVEMVRAQFLAALEARGVRPMAALGLPFDPAAHDAVTAVPAAEQGQDGLVVGVVRQGYTIGEDVLRPAVVAVAAWNAAGAPT